MSSEPSATKPARRRFAIFHQNSELYGADRILAEVAEIIGRRADVRVYLPVPGPLVEELRQRDVSVTIFPKIFVVRKATLHPKSWPDAVKQGTASLRAIRSELRSWRPDTVFVNTITIPTPILAARMQRLRTVIHVHEAETQMSRPVQKALTSPLLLGRTLIVISDAVKRFLVRNWSRLDSRSVVIRNPVRSPRMSFDRLPTDRPEVLEVVTPGRWSPRKGTDAAIAGCAEARRRGVPVHLTLVGSVYTGYEWFEEQLRRQAADVLPKTTFASFLPDPDVLWRNACVTLVPSRVEPYGLVAAESLVRGRITIAANVDGLPEIVSEGRTGYLTEPEPGPIADALERIWNDWSTARSFAEAGAREGAAWTGNDFERRICATLDLEL